MKKKLIIVGLITCFLGIGTIYACVCTQNGHNFNYPNCTQNGYHEHYNENGTYHCPVSGCEITSYHTHGNNAYNSNNYNNNNNTINNTNNNTNTTTETYGHHGNGHHRNSCHHN